jgi:hypothetical protein
MVFSVLTQGFNSDYLITIDRAKLILEIDHMISVRDFGLLPFAAPAVPQSIPSQPQGQLSSRVIFIDPGFFIFNVRNRFSARYRNRSV